MSPVRCISAFFAKYPTPTSFAQRVIDGGQTDELRALIHSLGLFDDRVRSLAAITTAFLAGDDRFEVGLEPAHKVHGVGQFGVHSFLIFVRDQGATLKASDAALVTFCNWRRKQTPEAVVQKLQQDEHGARAQARLAEGGGVEVVGAPAAASPAAHVDATDRAGSRARAARARMPAAAGLRTSKRGRC